MLRNSNSMACWLLVNLLAWSFPTALLAQQDSLLLRRLQQKLLDAAQRRQALFDGQERALICSYCHGKDGNSVKPHVPNLAGQNPDYLLEQIGRFARGERKDFVMNSLASKFTDDDQVNLAIYYAEQRVKPERADPARVKQGRRVYLARCQTCHGEYGTGNPGYARLAGQKQQYIEKTLKRFRANTVSPASSKQRRSSVMESIAGALSDQDIGNLAAYLTSM